MIAIRVGTDGALDDDCRSDQAATVRLLIVEDEPDLLRGLAQALREDGYAVDEAADGTEGLFKAQAWNDAVLSQVLEGFLTNVRDVSSDLLRP